MAFRVNLVRMPRIATVDDSAVARAYIRQALGDDIEVVEFATAPGIIAALRSGLKVDGVVSDLWIDGETENWTAALVVRYCHGQAIPVVVVTSQRKGLVKISQELGCEALSKPVDGAALRRALGLT